MRALVLITAALFAACGGDGDADDSNTRAADPAGEVQSASAFASDMSRPTAEELESGRLDSAWRRWADADASERRAARGAASGARPGQTDNSTSGSSPATGRDAASRRSDGDTASAGWDDISPEAVNARATGLPLGGDIAGPDVVRLQVLLDRVRFRPGIIDGRWGKNTEKAVYWFQNERDLEATGSADRQTMDRLEREAGLGDGVVVAHTLTAADVEGPFVSLPEDIYERAEKDCLCYESLREKLGEVFHTSPELLEQLNPGVDLRAVSAGDRLHVPAVEPFDPDALPDGKYEGGGPVARIVISDGGHYLHALDGDGSILYHFPTTLGSDYAPSPSGEFSVTSITFDPTWHYQPDLLTGVDPSREDAVLPPGPNNAVGIVWMQLSRPHYGIHGTAAPETIGYVTSHGCVRLTNWDAGLLGQNLPAGTEVQFRDVSDA
ncbi:MAG: L,D-transpeptidase family protein [Gemmatimonadetes bacterium]|nr:L,D-transpeptidase family protein [Gemmatimonadota bacterium]